MLRVKPQIRRREKLHDAEKRRRVHARKKHRGNRRRQLQRLPAGNRHREIFRAVQRLRANFKKRARAFPPNAPVLHFFAGHVENFALPAPDAENFERNLVQLALQNFHRRARVDDRFLFLNEKRLVQRNLVKKLFRRRRGNGGGKGGGNGGFVGRGENPRGGRRAQKKKRKKTANDTFPHGRN